MTARVSVQPVQLSPAELPALARVLGDSPETAIPVHRLMRGACSAYVVGKPTRFEAAVIVSHDNPGEPDGFGEDPEALWSILGPLEGWRVVDVSASVAPKLGAQIRTSTGSQGRLLWRRLPHTHSPRRRAHPSGRSTFWNG